MSTQFTNIDHDVTLKCHNTSVTTHFKKLTTGNNVFSPIYCLNSKVTVTSCSFYIKSSTCPPCCWTTPS